MNTLGGKMTLSSYMVLSEHYRGNPAIRKSSEPPIISSDKIINGKTFVAPTVSQFAEKWSPIIEGDNVVTVTSSGNKYPTLSSSYIRFGPITGQIDDYRMKEWRANGEDNHPSLATNSPIPRMPEISFFEGTRLGLHLPDKNDTPVNLQVSNSLVEAIPLNKVGVYVSKTADMKILLHSMMKNGDNYAEAREWIEFLEKKGLVNDKTPFYGYGTSRGDFIAAQYPGVNLIARDYNFRDAIRRKINRQGIDGKDAVDKMADYIMKHEMTHQLGLRGEAKHEPLQGRLQQEFYSMLAKRYAGTRKGMIYQAIAEDGARYEQAFSGSLFDRIFAQREQASVPSSLIVRMEAEARALGLEGYEKQGYISDRINEVLGPTGPFYKASKLQKSQISDKRKSEKNLDRIVEEEIEGNDSKIDERVKYDDSRLASPYNNSPRKYESAKAKKEGKNAKGRNKSKSNKNAERKEKSSSK